ncbi:MAG TPA: acetylornithine deacetylase [Ilumatobacteraceae bacterium]
MPASEATTAAGQALAHLLSDLVAFPTESRTPNLELIRWVGDHLEASGARVSVLDRAGGRANLLASFGPRCAGGLMLSGHSDVVPAGAGWATDPYSVSKVGDSLYGRGTADMKGFIAAAIRACEQLPTDDLIRPLHIVLSYDEEVGCVGVRHALDHFIDHDEVRPDLVVIGEPTMMRPSHSHMGKLAYQVTCTTEPGHSSLSHTMPSAIATAVRLIAVIDDLQRAHRPDGDPEVTFNCGTIDGGTALNVVAPHCTFNFEVRHTVDHDPDDLLTPLMDAAEGQRRALGSHGSIGFEEITRYPALRTPSDDPWLRRVERIADAGPAGSIGYGTEGGLFAEALNVPVVICGPGDITVAHRPDEYVTVDQLLRCERFLVGLVQQICAQPGLDSET